MIRTLKTLGLALLAVFALSATAASAASANDLFTSQSETTYLTGESSNPVLELEKGEGGVVCAKGTYEGTGIGEATEEVTVTPTYDSPCVALGSFEATVHTNGCQYILTGETHTIEGETHATVSVECPGTAEIEVTIWIFGEDGVDPPEAVLHIGTQGPLLGATYDNTNTAENGTGTETVTVTATVEGIHTSCTGSDCFLLPGGGSVNNAFYGDDVSVTGYEDSAHEHQVHISVSSEA